jgi:hypothetical protein
VRSRAPAARVPLTQRLQKRGAIATSVPLWTSTSGLAARDGLLHPPGAPAVGATQRPIVGGPVGSGLALPVAQEQWDPLLARARVPGSEQTVADGHVRRSICAKPPASTPTPRCWIRPNGVVARRAGGRSQRHERDRRLQDGRWGLVAVAPGLIRPVRRVLEGRCHREGNAAWTELNRPSRYSPAEPGIQARLPPGSLCSHVQRDALTHFSQLQRPDGRLDVVLDRKRAVTRSTRSRPLCARSTLRDDLRVPAFDLWAKPELRAAATEVDDRARHVRVLPLVLADGVAVSETEQPRNLLRVDQVVDVDFATHVLTIHP